MLVSQKEVNNCDITSENTYKYPSVIGFSPLRQHHWSSIQLKEKLVSG